MYLKKQQWLNNVFKETTMAEQYILKKQQSWTMYFKEKTMDEQCILKKKQWMNNVS